MEGQVRSNQLFITFVIALLASIILVPSPGLRAEKPEKADSQQIERGKYLVDTIGGCNDCHTPKVFSEKGPQPDMSRMLSGHPADEKLPGIPPGVIAPDQWGALTNSGLTAWAGPWGISFAANLTPDHETGLGSWTEEIFIKAIRTGKHLGEGRDILPPMPWPGFAAMTDHDLKAMFAYLRTIKPIKNAVPDPLPPVSMQK